MATIVHKTFPVVSLTEGTSLDFSLRIHRADNELCVFFNGRQLYAKKTDGNPDLKGKKVQLPLERGENNLAIVGWNGNAKGHYKWDLFFGEGRLEEYFSNDRPIKKNGVAAVYSIKIIVP